MCDKVVKSRGLLVLAAALAGCSTEPTYSPPEGPSAADFCPIGKVWVCRDYYPSRLGREGPPEHCTCEYPAEIW